MKESSNPSLPLEALKRFPLTGEVLSCAPYGNGHINDTYRVETTGALYILQRINTHVFPDVAGLMNNIASVTRFLSERVDDPRGAMHLVPTVAGEAYYKDARGDCWRVYDFVTGSVCLQKIERAEDFYECAFAFGRFQQTMEQFPAATLVETIPDFHNTPDRYRKLDRAMEEDRMDRVKEVTEEIAFARSLAQEAGKLHALRTSAALPTRVTHNDTKINNVLMDETTGKALCVIDLDTVMPGLAAYDFGDSIRFGAATAAEDEEDLSRMRLDVDLFETYARGFLAACDNLTALEIETLPLGALTMTLECGVRFLTDYLSGDVYFKIHRPDHNLLRCRTQFALAADIRRHMPRLKQIVSSLSRG